VILCQSAFWQLVWNQLLASSLLEWAGVVTGFLCVYLAAKQHVLNWPTAIISTLIYCFIYFDAKLYGDSGLQVYFLITCVYGWYYWIKRKQSHAKPIVSLRGFEYLWVVLAIGALTLLLGAFLDKFTNTDVPYIDGACTAISFVAQLLLTRKVLQNWILWIIVDICYVPLLLYKNLALTALLYAFYLILATIGYLDWLRTWRQTNR
jgi:nicotinamide mononucleotide transporter